MKTVFPPPALNLKRLNRQRLFLLAEYPYISIENIAYKLYSPSKGSKIWNSWCKVSIPKAEQIYQEHLKTIGVHNGNLQDYIAKRGITKDQMVAARQQTFSVIEAFNLREARKASEMTQVELAESIGVSQNRISRMENGDMGAMSIDSLRKYIAALGGSLKLIASLPTGTVEIA